jgi:hypothetical protein
MRLLRSTRFWVVLAVIAVIALLAIFASGSGSGMGGGY